MLRKDFYFRQIVTEGELDASFDGVEAATQNFAIDNDLAQKANGGGVPFSTSDTTDFNSLLGGIVRGLTVTITGLTATVSAGTAYDYLGRRINVPAPLTIDLSVTGDTSLGLGGVPAGGTSTGGIPSGQFRFILLMVYFNRVLSDPRTDGNGSTVYFNKAESFQFRVKASNPGPTPTIPGGDANCVILGAFKRNDSNAITVQDFSTRGDWLRTYAIYSASTLPAAQTEDGTLGDVNFIRGTPRQAIIKLRNAINLGSVNYANHISQAAPQDRHAAKNIDFTATAAGWADGGGGLPTIVGGGTASFGLQATINSIVSVLGNSTTGQGGTKKIGGASLTGSPIAVASGTLRSQLQAIIDGLNTHLSVITAAHAATSISASGAPLYFATDVQGILDALIEGTAKLAFDNIYTSNASLNTSVPNIVQFDQGTVLYKSGFAVQGMSGALVNNSVDFGLADTGGPYLAYNASPADATHWQITNGLSDANMLSFNGDGITFLSYSGASPFSDSAWVPQIAIVPNGGAAINWRYSIEPQGTVKVAAAIFTDTPASNHTINCTITYPSSTVCRLTFATGIIFPTLHYIAHGTIYNNIAVGDYWVLNASAGNFLEFRVLNSAGTPYTLTSSPLIVAVSILY